MNDSPTKEKHIHDASVPIRVFILLVSDSISAASEADREKLDLSGATATELIEKASFEVLGKDVVPDEIPLIRAKVLEQITTETELIITIGGTGITKRNVTIEALRPLMDKELPGFGELFRYLTYQEIGSVSIASRATLDLCIIQWSFVYQDLRMPLNSEFRLF